MAFPPLPIPTPNFGSPYANLPALLENERAWTEMASRGLRDMGKGLTSTVSMFGEKLWPGGIFSESTRQKQVSDAKGVRKTEGARQAAVTEALPEQERIRRESRLKEQEGMDEQALVAWEKALNKKMSVDEEMWTRAGYTKEQQGELRRAKYETDLLDLEGKRATNDFTRIQGRAAEAGIELTRENVERMRKLTPAEYDQRLLEIKGLRKQLDTLEADEPARKRLRGLAVEAAELDNKGKQKAQDFGVKRDVLELARLGAEVNRLRKDPGFAERRLELDQLSMEGQVELEDLRIGLGDLNRRISGLERDMKDAPTEEGRKRIQDRIDEIMIVELPKVREPLERFRGRLKALRQGKPSAAPGAGTGEEERKEAFKKNFRRELTGEAPEEKGGGVSSAAPGVGKFFSNGGIVGDAARVLDREYRGYGMGEEAPDPAIIERIRSLPEKEKSLFRAVLASDADDAVEFQKSKYGKLLKRALGGG